MRFHLIISFAVGCGLLLAAFGIGWADWGELTNRVGIMQILMGALGVVVVLLAASGILSRGKERWTGLILVSVLLLGFSALAFASIGMITAPVALILLGVSIWKLAHRHTTCEAVSYKL